ncbi:hypothetical protein [Mesorhizobium sp. M0862]|uniref:hypothetical protein n=1 Tax=Mesorhizobium sp. M0862 TaxID=2957015 RepID=UPI003336FE0D
MRDDRIVKMCVAVASGLFDAAINYVWNAAVVELRDKVRRFGINVVPQILDDKSFDEDTLLDLKEAELLDLCRKLNLIGDDDFFFLDQCRATRNSFSILAPERVERRPKRVYIDMVEERGEPFLLPQPCGFPYAVQRLGHASPTLCPVHALLFRVPLGPRPWFHQLCCRLSGFVRRLHGYYAGVRLLLSVHHRLRLLAFPMRTGAA